ncbi:MAG: cysteine--tRNA ligase [Coxiellaceae bacterium]|nr:cysteine--tRNA ligase [Coxiellaceae bacterium]
MKIYDSLHQEKRDFVPLVPGEVTLYVCGNTVYDDCHIGHARAAVIFDMVARTFRALNYRLTWVRNITDIDDKIIQRALQNNETTEALTERVINSMHQDEQAIGVMPPDHEPRATDYVPQMIALIQRLIDKEMAYVANNGDVYFSVKSYHDYGQLSRRDVDALMSGVRIDANDDKHNPLDFALWKHAKPDEPSWASPWGDGRPGWHIECSAMAAELLGETIDIHGGGMDLKFPHHENEIAQSQAAHGCTLANYWMHVGLLTINDEKMSKSLGNSITISHFLSNHHPEVLRHFMLGSHYRSPINYTESAITNSQQALERLYTAIRGLESDIQVDIQHPSYQAFLVAMSDDFNTPQAFAVLFDVARDINRLRQKEDITQAKRLVSILRSCGALLGILQDNAESFLQSGSKSLDSEAIDQLVHARDIARAQKDWQQADALRQQLDDIGVVLEDTAEGTQWRMS